MILKINTKLHNLNKIICLIKGVVVIDLKVSKENEKEKNAFLHFQMWR